MIGTVVALENVVVIDTHLKYIVKALKWWYVLNECLRPSASGLISPTLPVYRPIALDLAPI